ncbi:MAG TPA: hypothetical protein VD978_02470 [Azospirillum sp.]|nr:hypothetical protein [Azospirillum sp.]
MAWKRKNIRQEVEGLLVALERQAREAMDLAGRAQRDMGDDRFASFLDFRRKVEEVRALAALTEDRLKGLTGEKLADLRAEFERMDLLLTTLLVKATRNYFGTMRDDQVLPIGARELFEPELRNVEETRAKLAQPRFEGKVPAATIVDLEETSAMIRKIISRVPSLPDFSDTPSTPKPVRRLRTLGRPIRT